MNVNTFSGNPILEFLPDGRNMRVWTDFKFADTKRIWIAKKGCIVNGASIPEQLWSIMGSPFVGLYRNAAILHDCHCDARIYPWQEVHEMFYHAMLISGVDKFKAKLMFNGVYFCGPRWDEKGNDIVIPNWDDTFNLDLDLIGG